MCSPIILISLLVPACLAFSDTAHVSTVTSERLNFTQLAEKYGQKCETHIVVTADGYILTIFRLKGKGKPVLLWHGLFDSSDTYIIRGNISTSVQLAIAGYDVWVGNSRGNKYSRNHTILDPDVDKALFWDYSFHEMGYYDLPATIDYILNITQQKALSAIGHSQGTTIFFILGSTRPEYNEKVKLFIALAPVAYAYHVKPLARDLVPLWPLIKAGLVLSGVYEMFPGDTPLDEMMEVFCAKDTVGFQVCEQGLVMPIVGNDTEELEQEFFAVTLNYFPAGSSRKDVEHYVQFVHRKQFANFDYGKLKNLAKYGTYEPPLYNLKNVTMGVALLCGANDHLSTLEDVALLRDELPNIVLYKVMEREQFNHLDFIWGKHINVYLNPLLKQLLAG